MPYIITTSTIDRERHGVSWPAYPTRRAVATLEEARSVIQTDLCDWHGATGPDDPNIVATLDLFEASGGTIGPLPGGAVIEVERVSLATLHARVVNSSQPLSAGLLNAPERLTIDAYNAAQAISA